MTEANKRMKECRVCLMNYLKDIATLKEMGMQEAYSFSPPECQLYQELAHISINGRDGICGNLEIILRDLDKLETGNPNLTYPQVKEWVKE